MKFDSVTRIIAATVVAVTTLGVSGCGAPQPTPHLEPTRDSNATRVAFYGDSYTLGTGATSHDARWSSIVSEQRGWSEFNPSVNGLGFINNRTVFGTGDLPSQIIADDPDIVFITMGLNDNFSFATRAEDIRRQITEDFERLVTSLPETRVIVVEPFWYKDERPDSVETIILWVEEAASEIGADYIPEASQWIAGHPEWIASDGLHPNDDGYAAIASQMDRALRTLGL